MALSSGTVTFNSATTPNNYVFSLSTIVSSLGGTQLTANDFDSILGTTVPANPGANLLQLDFLASNNAFGLFGIFAVPGQQNTIWADSGFTSQNYTNVFDNGTLVEIGEIRVTPSTQPAVPEPSTLTLLWVGLGALASKYIRRNNRR